MSVCTSDHFKYTLVIRIRFGRKMMALQIKPIYPYFKTYLYMSYVAALKSKYSSKQNAVIAFSHPLQYFVLVYIPTDHFFCTV
jgi:hypothetical protein